MANNETSNIRIRAASPSRLKFDPNQTSSSIKHQTGRIPTALAGLNNVAADGDAAKPSKNATQTIRLQVVRPPEPAPADNTATQTINKDSLTKTGATPRINLAAAGSKASQSVQRISMPQNKTATQTIPKFDPGASKTATQQLPKISVVKPVVNQEPAADPNADTQNVPKISLAPEEPKATTQAVPKITVAPPATPTIDKTQVIPVPEPKMNPTDDKNRTQVIPMQGTGRKFSLKKTEESAAVKAHEPQAPVLDPVEAHKADAPAEPADLPNITDLPAAPAEKDAPAPAPAADEPVLEIGDANMPFNPEDFDEAKRNVSKQGAILSIAACIFAIAGLYFLVMDLLKYM